MVTETNRTLFLNSLDKKEYLGDGVYVGVNSNMVTLSYGVLVLYTDNGIAIENIIFLDDSILLELFKYTKKIV